MTHVIRLLMAASVWAVAVSSVSQATVESGIDSQALDALVRRAGELDTDALVVRYRGKQVLEKWFDGKPRKIEAMSVTKSIVSLAFGRLVTTGLLKSLDQPVGDWYPEWKQGRKRQITIRHLLTQTSGLQADAMTGSEIDGCMDVVQLALCAELSDPPGTRFFYNNKATNLLAGLVRRVSGKPLDVFLKEEVFKPLEITDSGWKHDPAGNPGAMAGLEILPADLAKLGQLMLDEGKWGTEEVVARDWVREATTGQVLGTPYGQLWWLIRDGDRQLGFRGDGWQGQQLVVLKSEGLVVARMREPSEGNTVEENKKYGFHELTRMARALVTGILPAAKPARLLDDKQRGWTDEARERINAMILAKGNTGAGYDAGNRPVAAFDWDNTIFKNDMGDATMYWMLRHDKVLQPSRKDWSTTNANLTSGAVAALNSACDSLAPAGKPLPTSTGTSCADEILAIYDGGRTTGGATAFRNAQTLTQKQTYAWLAQLQAGYAPAEIREFALAAYKQIAKAAVGSTQTTGSSAGVTAWGRIYDPMRDLIGALEENGFDVWVVTASPQSVIEPIAEMVGIGAGHVIGIRTVPKDGKATAALQGCGGIADGPDAPITFDAGKRCWLNKVVFGMPDGPAQLEPHPDLARRQVFAAGDSDTDIAFMKDATFLKLAVNRNQPQLMCNAYANRGNRWVVQPMFLLPKPAKTSGYPCSTALDHGGRVIVDEAGAPIADQLDRVFDPGK